MAKYLVMWEMDLSRASTDLKLEASKSIKFVEMIKQDIKEGKTVDWGCFAGGAAGYAIMEGNATDVFKRLYQYSPFVIFKAHPVISEDEVMDAAKSMMG